MQVVATRIDEGSPLAGTKLKDLSKKYDDFYFRVVSIARGINTIIPSGDEELRPGDNAFILARTEDLPRLMELAGVPEERRHRVMIIGGGLVGSRVAELLENTFPVRLIERDEQRAEELSHTPGAHRDPARRRLGRDTLLQAGLLDMDTIIAATGDNETNIMSCVLAKNLIENHAGDRAATDRQDHRPGRPRGVPGAGLDHGLGRRAQQEGPGRQRDPQVHPPRPAALGGPPARLRGRGGRAGGRRRRADHPQAAVPDRRHCKGKIIIGGFARGDEWQTAVGSTHLQPGDKVHRGLHLRPPPGPADG